MDKVVTKLPLEYLWDDNCQIQAVRSRFLTRNDIQCILRAQSVEFVIADIGKKIKFIGIENCFQFWKEASSHIIENPDRIILEDYPNNTGFLASEWIDKLGTVFILLEKYH